MKKFFTTFLMASMLLTAHASLELNVVVLDENEDEVDLPITKDTTITVSTYEEDFFTGEVVMSLYGDLSTTSKDIKVTITRYVTGINDQFCMGSCYVGNGELKQELDLTLFQTPSSWFTHFYPTEASATPITYTFNDGVNAPIALTVRYCYLTSAVDNVTSPNFDNNIYNLLGQQMPSNDLSELPAGIYIINGKKYVKQ